jgi:hypothetical protein
MQGNRGNENGVADLRRDAVELSRKHYRHTEGVGEIYEDQVRWFLPRARFGSPSLVSATLCKRWWSLTLRPADALCRSLEPARLGRSSIQPRRPPARVTRSSAHVMPKTDSGVAYFFFRRFVFFAVFFAAAFVLRFFAIAALLA